MLVWIIKNLLCRKNQVQYIVVVSDMFYAIMGCYIVVHGVYMCGL